MALIYVKSTTGNDANSGADWANAKATLLGADAIDAAGDTIYVSQAHAEVSIPAITLGFSGALTNPTKIICVDDSANPPTAVATTATVTSNAGISFAGGSHYCYGIAFHAGSGAGSFGLNLGNSNHHQTYENCQFLIGSTGGGSFIRAGVNSLAQQAVTLINCDIRLLGIAHVFSMCARLHWKGGAVIAGGTSPTVLFSYLTQAAELLCENVDFSNFGAGFNVTNAPPTDANCAIRNCKLPTNWTGNLLNGSFAQMGRAEMYNCWYATDNYRLWIEDFLGSVRHETTVVRTGGASDGVTPISWKIISTANSIYPWNGHKSPLVVYDNATTGSPVTLTAHFIHDSATDLTNGEICLEVSYLGTGSAPIGTRVTDLKADILTTASNHPTSSAVWNTTGLAVPNEQQLSVTFTPQLKGRYLMKVILFKASKTIYLCPKFEVTISKTASDEYQVPGGPYVLDQSTTQYMIPADTGYSEGTFLIGTGGGMSPQQMAQYYYVL